MLAADNMVIASYMMINISIRLYPDFNDCFRYRDVGLEAAQSLLEYLDYDNSDDANRLISWPWI